jgi:hypothetical protein
MKVGIRNFYDRMWKILHLYKERFSPTQCGVSESDREASKGYQAVIKKKVFSTLTKSQ